MAKIARKTQLQFGGSATGTQIAQFGSLAAGTPAFTTDPAVIQSLANYLTGWFGAVMGGNSPAIEDMNALCYLFAYQIAYGMQAGIPEWDAGTTYYIGSMVNVAGSIYVSKTNANLNNATTDGTNWKTQGGGVTNVSTTYTALVSDEVVRGDTTSGSFTITLPTIATSVGKNIYVKNIGANTLSVKGNGAELIDGANLNANMTSQYDSTRFFNNGTSWDIL
jgi:hypothetical protein